MTLQHATVATMDQVGMNEHFGFRCLHYSVSEASGTIEIIVNNKSG